MERPPTFGATLRRLRRAAGLTQEELATRAQLSAKAISALERGVNTAPRRETLLLLSKALRLSARDRAALESMARLARREVMPDAPSEDSPQYPPSSPSLPIPYSSAEPASRRFVGRIPERIAIDRHLQGEAPPVLLIRGEPGIGKTRLPREAAEDAIGRGYTLIESGCHRRSGQEPYAPLPSALNRYFTTMPPSHVRAALMLHQRGDVPLLPPVTRARGADGV